MSEENKRISELPSGSSLQVTDWFAVRRGTENYYLTGQMILDAANVDLTAINTSIGNLEADRLKLDGSNSPMTGNLDMGANKIVSSYTPTNDEDLANKEYVDKFLERSGGSMTGFVTLNADPINALHTATKQYVDVQIAGIGTIPVDTNDLPEGIDGTATGSGTELDGNRYYYTIQRFDDRFSAKSTDNLSEGALNYYFTTARFNSVFASKDTDNLSEGVSNLYYTNGRARLAISAGTGILYDSVTGVVTLDAGSLPTPSYGASTRIPYMNGTADDFLYSGNFVFDGTNVSLTSFININPGSDIDIDLIRVGVTGTPKISWGETENAFILNGASLNINNAYQFPSTDGAANQVLKTNGAGVLTWESSTGITSTGTNNHLARFNPNGQALVDSLLEDNGSVIGINALNPGTAFNVETVLTNGIRIINSYTGGLSKGLLSSAQGINAAANYGIQATASNSTSENIAGQFVASGTNPYALQLVDGTEAVGKFLKVVAASGKANWASLTESDISDLGTYAKVGAYTDGYIPRWNATVNTLESGSVRDNGLGNVAINSAVNTNQAFRVVGTSSNINIYSSNTYANPSGSNFSIWGVATGTANNNNYGVTGLSSNATGNNVGVAGSTNSITPQEVNLKDIGVLGGLGNITGATLPSAGLAASLNQSNNQDTYGLYINVSNPGTGNAYIGVLKDGTEGAGKVLTSDANGLATWQTPSSSSGGQFGISDSSGVYTYYTTLTLAIAAAVSGDTIEMFTDVEETTNTTITLIDEITINGNGHTYTLNVDDTADAFTFTVANGTAYFNNIKVVRTGRALGTATGAIGNFVNNTIKCQGAVFINDYGRGFIGDGGSIYNAHIISVEHGIYAPFSSKNLYNCHIEVSSSSAMGTYLSGGLVNNCYVKAVGIAINVSAGQIYNSIGISTNNYGISSNGEIYDSIGKSTSGIGLNGQRATNCVGISSTNYGTNVSESRNSTFISVSGRGAFRGNHQNATIISSSNIGINEPVNLDSCYIESSSNIPINFRDNSEIRNSSISSKWNNAGGHGTTSFVARTNPIVTNTSIKVANASAYCLNMYPSSTLRFANNSFSGATTPVNTSNVTQGIVNTSDSQGNILV